MESEEVINSSELKIGQNIFFVGKNKATQKIEKALPYVKVENIVSKFPNKLVINISERVEEFYVTYETDANKFYLILDNELKILKVVEQKEDVYRKDSEIGYYLLQEVYSKGIMTEAVRQICEIAFEKLDIVRITGMVYEPNIASKKVLERNNFLLEGVMKQAVIKNNNIYDLCIYGRVR